MRIVITGGAGFIGGHLAKRWIREDHEIFIIDCLHDYYTPERKLQHLKDIKKAGDFTFHQINLLEKKATEELLEKIKPDAVVHLAALPGVAYSISHPLEYVDYDIKATINILEASGKANVKKFIFASSSSVYGNKGMQGRVSEEMANSEVISPYAASKYSAESFCHVYKHLYHMEIAILRFFTVYGPWGRPDMAIGTFIRKLMNGETLPIFDMNNARDYTYIDDIIDGIDKTLHYHGDQTIFNLGHGHPVSMDELLRELAKHFPHLVTDVLERRVGDVYSTWSDLSKSKALLGYTPKISFQEGIARTVEWAKQYERY
ncbi:GDP-mannose 4,6-dehydratase [Halalkalibacter urbisdiaboli]|uniref:GDP-mannose 4,6-dehydratase n=1 Tax=Halalkalibacter urbisdiaboli TaxID=1960589 RepID=UPI001FDA0E1E|nr:NAD-dependent epimerase/dehydratase family protein [Halalkalibacter urbisdiaboli]